MDTASAAGVLAAAADIAIVLDAKGVIREVTLNNPQIPLGETSAWVGKSWTGLVTSESKVKVEELLQEANGKSAARWRHINYPSAQGADVPILCSAVQVGKQGDVIAFGRDLRGMASLQQRLVEAHQAMERDYLRMRHMETRYRLLFELAAEAILIADSKTLKIVEANPASAKLLGMQAKKMIGKTVIDVMPSDERGTVDELLNGVRASGDPDFRTLAPSSTSGVMTISASLFRQENGALFLVRLSPALVGQPSAQAPQNSIMLEVLEHSPDGFVVSDLNGKILTCNHAFVEMAQLTKTDQLIGRNLSDLLGRADVDLNVLIANIQQRGAVRLFATLLHGTNGGELQVEISGVSVKSGPLPCLGFSVRDVGRRLGTERPSLHQLPRSADQLVELVGRVPLQEIVSETADLIEKLCIEAALRLTRDNRASAAEMLGLSRQSLYVKLRRYNIGEVTDRSKK
jgi:transcriptional regulator PpsR